MKIIKIISAIFVVTIMLIIILAFFPLFFLSSPSISYYFESHTKESLKAQGTYGLLHVVFDEKIEFKEVPYTKEIDFNSKWSDDFFAIKLFYTNFNYVTFYVDKHDLDKINKSLIGLSWELYEKDKLLYTNYISVDNLPAVGTAYPDIQMDVIKIKKNKNYKLIIKIPKKLNIDNKYLHPTLVGGIGLFPMP